MRIPLLLALTLAAPALLACNLHDPGARMVAKRAESSGYWVTPGISGAWFDPQRSGEGWIIEVQPNGEALVAWFTHAPADEAAGQRWIVAQNGRISGNRIEFTQANTFRGGRFGPQFDPAMVQAQEWGTLNFEFDDCGNGRVSYAGRDGFGSGARDIVRLIGVHEASCAGVRALNASGARAPAGLKSISGTWFDPTHSGEGLFLQSIDPSTVVATWFTYTDNGEPAWLTGVGSMIDGVLRVTELTRPQGTRFGAAFDPAAVNREAWGSLEIAFDSCQRASLSYASSQPVFGSGALQLQPLTRAAGAVCLDTLAPARTAGVWSGGPSQPQPSSEVATAVLDGDIYVAGNLPTGRTFQRFSTNSGAWTALTALPGGRDHALMVADGDALWLFGGYRAGPDFDSHGWRYAPATAQFEPIPNELAGSVAASGAVHLNGWFYLGDVDGSLVQYDPRSGASRRVPHPGSVYRDHAALVEYLGELWLIAGRTAVGNNVATVSIFDPASERWRPGPSLFSSRSGFGAAVVGDQIMLAGGERLTGNVGVISSMEVMAAGANAWVTGPVMPTAVHGVGAAAVGGRLYMLGGSTRAGVANNPGALQIYQPLP